MYIPSHCINVASSVSQGTVSTERINHTHNAGTVTILIDIPGLQTVLVVTTSTNSHLHEGSLDHVLHHLLDLSVPHASSIVHMLQARIRSLSCSFPDLAANPSGSILVTYTAPFLGGKCM